MEPIPHLIIEYDDFAHILYAILLVPLFAVLIGWLLNFVPVFMSSLVSKVSNKSIIETKTLADQVEFKEAMKEKI